MTNLRLVAAADVHHAGELVLAAESALLFPLVTKAGVPETVGELTPAAAHIHHTFPLVRRATHGRLTVEAVDAILLAAFHLSY